MHINCLVNSSDNPSEEAETMSQSQLLSYVQLFETPRTIACQGPLSMGFSWQEYWSGLPYPSLGDLSNPGIESESPVSPALKAEPFSLSHQGIYHLTLEPSSPLPSHSSRLSQSTKLGSRCYTAASH